MNRSPFALNSRAPAPRRPSSSNPPPDVVFTHPHSVSLRRPTPISPRPRPPTPPTPAAPPPLTPQDATPPGPPPPPPPPARARHVPPTPPTFQQEMQNRTSTT